MLKEYELLPGHILLVEESQTVAPGTPLTTGALDPRRLHHLQGREATARYLLKEVQQIYRATGVFLNEKHFEVVVRQMLRYVQLTDPGDTSLVQGEIIDRLRFLQINAHILAQGGEPARAHPVLPGLIRAALLTSSWVAAASFQETSNVLINAAIRRQIDPLRGYKERIVLGARIPQHAG